MCAMMIGVLIAMTMSAPEGSYFKYVVLFLIIMEALLYWTLCFSEPGVPQVILAKAEEIEATGASNSNNAINDDDEW